jgi:hypothetical protein
MSQEKTIYEAPSVAKIGAFEAVTRGGTTGSRFDGTFTHGQTVPVNPFGVPLIFS